MEKLVSVIVPIYNVELYLEKCVASIMNQTYKMLEIILVNDGSTDSCEDICNKLALCDERIKVIHKANGGLSDARNSGIAVSKGDYIFFVDSDDWIEHETIEYLVDRIEKYDVDIVACGINRIKNNIIINNPDKDVFEEQMSSLEALNTLYRDGKRIEIMAWNKLYRKSLFLKVRFEFGKINEDIFFTPKVLFYASSVLVSSKQLYNYVIEREGSISNKPLTRKNLDVVEAFESNAVFFEKKKMYEMANIYWMKYYGMIITMYCKYRKQGSTQLMNELQERYRSIFKQHMRVCLETKDYRQLSKGILFRVAKNIYYNTWRNSYEQNCFKS